jgi:hypothetical protein
MPDGGWEPVEPRRASASEAAGAPGETVASGRVARSPHRGRLAAGAAGLVVAVVVWAVVGRDPDGGAPDADDPTSEVRERTDDERAAEATADAAAHDDGVMARRAFAQASRQLELAASYRYHGTAHVPAESDARPAQAPTTDVTVDGEVLWPLRTHDVAVDATGRAAETVTVGPSIWQRRAPTEPALAALPYAFAGDVATWAGGVVPFGAGAARLPGWLAATTDRRYRSERSGRQTFTATLPAGRFGETRAGAPPVDGQVVLTVDVDGDPLRIDVEITGAGPRSFWRVNLEITGLGDAVTIDLPNGELPAVTDGPSPAAVRTAGLAVPVELGRLPEGWMLGGIELTTDPLDCPTLVLVYGALDDSLAEQRGRGIDATGPGFLHLRVMPPPCAEPAGPGRSLRVGAFAGAPQRFPEGGGGVLTDGHTTLEYVSDLPADDVLGLLATLEPYDPATRPTAIGTAAA